MLIGLVGGNAEIAYGVVAKENNEHMDMEYNAAEMELQCIVEDYFHGKSVDLNITVCGDEAVMAANLGTCEADGFLKMKERMHIEYEDIQCEPLVLSAVPDGEDIQIAVYEWVGITYSCDGNSDSCDYMGYGVQHWLVLDAEKEVVGDYYRDADMTGITMEEYPIEMENIFIENQDEIAAFKAEKISQNVSVNATASSASAYSPGKAVVYAHMYCGIAPKNRVDSGAQESGNHTSYYNKEYSVYLNVDCANFVSQCLRAGGLVTDQIWYKDSNTWISVVRLTNYLKDVLKYSGAVASSSNIYPGNPVYWLSSDGYSTNHVMICTGKNSAGVPVIDAHNSDCYRIPYTNYSKNYKLYTIFISNTYTHYCSRGYTSNNASTHTGFCNMCCKEETSAHKGRAGIYSYNSQKHWISCIDCGYQMKAEAHSYKTVGSSKVCQVCGYTAGASASEYEEGRTEN